jgi:hypothetical protein
VGLGHGHGGGYGPGAAAGLGGPTLYRAVVEAPRVEYNRGYSKSTSSKIVSGPASPTR